MNENACGFFFCHTWSDTSKGGEVILTDTPKKFWHTHELITDKSSFIKIRQIHRWGMKQETVSISQKNIPSGKIKIVQYVAKNQLK